ncbi:MAG: ATP-binding protein [Sporichthyaceae bacterium]
MSASATCKAELVELRLLGPFELRDGGGAVLDAGPPQQRALLALLGLRANEMVALEVILDGLWGAAAPPRAVNTVQGYVSRLRRLLPAGAGIATLAPGYRLDVDPGAVDAARFVRAVTEGGAARARGAPERAAALLGAALQIWRGAPLGEFGAMPFAAAESERLARLVRAARHDWAGARLELGGHRELVEVVQDFLVEDRFNEGLWGVLMLALYRSGRQGDALAAFGRARQVLSSELGIEPGRELRQVQHRVLNQEATASPPPRRVPNNLPDRLTSFVGREAELGRVAQLLAQSRLVTLSGPGGCGKTSLAVRAVAAAVEAGDFGEGICFVDLSTAASPELVPAAVAAPLGVRAEPGRTLAESVADYLGRRQMLVVLDNCEHLVEAAAAMAEQLLRAGAILRVLATSRERLGVPGEMTWTIPSLSERDAARLFVERAQAAAPGGGTRDESEAVAEVCRRLDGMPLAIELAAARSSALTATQIVARLDDALRLLGEPTRAMSARQRTLRSTIEWSYQLLSGPERSLFDRLAVFTGGFTLEAAEAVGACGDVPGEEVLSLFTRLVDKSLVLRDADGTEGPRYRLLETLRQFGSARLVEDGHHADVQAVHARYFCTIAEQGEMRLNKAGAESWQRCLGEDSANFRAALTWAFADASRVETGARLVASLGRVWFIEGDLAQGGTWAAAALAATGGQRTFLRGRVLHIAALLTMSSDLDASAAHGDEALAIAEELSSSFLGAQAVLFVGLDRWARGRLEEARALLADGLHRSTHPGLDPHAVKTFGPDWACFPRVLVSSAAALLGRAAQDAGDLDAALMHLSEARSRARSLDVAFPLGVVLDLSAALELERGNLQEAALLIDEAAEHYRAVRYQEGLASLLNTKGLIHLRRGEASAATAAFADALDLCRRIGHLGGVASALDGIACVAAADDADCAARLFGAAGALRARLGAGVPATLDALHATLRADLGDRLGHVALAAALAAGDALTFDEAVTMACAVAPLSGHSSATQRALP